MPAVPYRLIRNLMLAAGILYCSLLLEVAAGFPLDVHASFLSELGARDQSTSPYARAMDFSSSALVLIAVVLARQAGRRNRQLAGLLISTAVFAAGTMSDSFSPMECAPSASAACRAAESSGHAGLAYTLHEATSTIAGAGTIAMGVFALLVLRRFGWGGWLGKGVAALAAAVVITQVWLGSVLAFETLGGGEVAAPGILQRVSTILVCLFLATLLPGLRHALSRWP
ncbi:uncharacterized protein DUF998 [Kribbella sp. VKM Ac-2571]|uniref:DUF998 domain-containing protein n=1 Tax=Kribbella sp. VKM Ac-2571 TaxID=2512222 RepID=UPI00105F2A8A|nr:DUF998 domain-containing protein [Kribbella sp. VKM Ac-2571]TDO62519.1 uncharacterized protein DUF998 [Kribbella sp. VKM Ac-2571]